MAQELRSGDVFVRIDDDAATYAIGNAELELQLRRAASGELVATSLRQGTTDWVGSASAVFGLATRSDAAASLQRTRARMVEEAEGVLALQLSGRIDGTSLAGEIVWRAYPGTTALTLRSSPRNEGGCARAGRRPRLALARPGAAGRDAPGDPAGRRVPRWSAA